MDFSFWIDHLGSLIALCGLVVCSGFFSGSETALFNLSRREQQAAGEWVRQLRARPQTLLNGLLLGNMLVNVAYSSIVAVMVVELEQTAGALWAAGVSLGALLTLILLGEVLPKMLAFAMPGAFAHMAAGVLVVLLKFLAPVLWILGRLVITPLSRVLTGSQTPRGDINVDELSEVLEMSSRRGVLDDAASTFVREILTLSTIRVGDIMLPRVDVVTFDLARGRRALEELCRKTKLRRIPVYHDDLDTLAGVIHARRLLLAGDEVVLESLIEPVEFVPEGGSIERALLQLRTAGRQMAIVVDEYGGTAGLITLEDILEEIVGDIPDSNELPAEKDVVRLDEHQYDLAGSLNIHDWTDAFGIRPHGPRISTLGGFLAQQLGRVPREGDVARFRNLRFTVRSVCRRRVGRVALELLEAEATA
ncbi:MAG: HlyC/CorC family transporter [Phycisphaerales bacterium]|jgi:putative hemolysin|nr:HlyC/CorC family transporter [Phycisphaerales bacterium]MBT7170782.1 HlyC/CorC family transporter [Phycisphaerales bacterium]